MDRAILDHTEVHEHPAFPEYAKVDEIPFDFSRQNDVRRCENTRRQCTGSFARGARKRFTSTARSFDLDGQLHPMDHVILADLKEEFDQLSADGFRVLALAYRDLEAKAGLLQGRRAQSDLARLRGLPRPTQGHGPVGHRRPSGHGVAVKVLTGDNELVSRKICREVGIATDQVLLGSQVEGMADADLAAAASKATLFARVSPAHKQRIIKSLQGAGHVVGFLGDGINDAPALRAADVGISVDTAVDIAKESADAILLEKDLLVLEEGVRGGAEGVRQHPQVHPHGGQFQLRQHVQRAGRQHLPAVRAHGPDPDPDQQPALRFLAGSHSRPTTWTRNRSPSRAPGR